MNDNFLETNDIDFITSNSVSELKKLSNSKIVITGGGGFLGFYFIKTFLRWNELNPKKKIKIVVYDNFIRGVPQWLKGIKNNNLSLKKFDVTNKLPTSLKNVNYFIHAASIASPTFYRKFPIETMDANVIGLRNLLEYSLKNKKFLKGFLFFSTSEIYGDPDKKNIPTKETFRGYVSSTGPRACYDESKRYGETMCVNFAKQHGLSIKIARPFNNYGPGLKINDGRVIPDFAKNILMGKNLVLLSDGSPKRTFCYIADAIVGYLKILTKGKMGEAYNIGIEKPEISVKLLANKMINISRTLFDYNGRVIFKTSKDRHYLTDNPNRRCPSIEKARLELNYNPKISIDDGLKKSMLWYKKVGLSK
tara:strand:- start:671 stop:1759 length:1089 start_codon:yes stop_codon:yes gene_type:complete